ncbi:MAG: N-acetylneuraminate synthase family protein, partial [Parcubacteria group bacterium]|nr:N-acetylneuraminate synthase family protein [Parcubacteria group bacterium]
DAVKFQTFSPDKLVTKDAKKAEYQKNEKYPSSLLPSKEGRRGGTGESQYEMLKRLVLPRTRHAELKRYVEKKGLIFLSTPFSLDDAKFLRKLGVPALKVGSSDTNNLPYLRRIAAWRIPVLLSTGMADMKEVREAVGAIRKVGRSNLILLHCTTNYPTPFAEANLRAIQTLQKEFGAPVGFSDHTVGSEAAIAAVALGAAVIEKHFTLDRNLPGPDHKASLEPDELRNFVRHIRNVEVALGSGKKALFESEREIAKVARKSVVALRDIKKGEQFTEENLGVKRPGTGLPPRDFDKIHGTYATRTIIADALLTEGDYQ